MKKGLNAISEKTTELWYKVNAKYGNHNYTLGVNGLGEVVLSKEYTEDIAVGNGDVNDSAWRLFLIETFLNAAYLYDNGDLLICLNFTGNNSKISLKIAEKTAKSGEVLSSNFAPSAPTRKKHRFGDAFFNDVFHCVERDMHFVRDEYLQAST